MFKPVEGAIRSTPILAAIPRILWSLVWLGLIVYAAFTLWLAFAGIFFPFQLDYGEGDVLWFTHQLAHGQPIYLPFGESYSSSNYPPILMLLAAPFDLLFGPSFVAGRWLSFAATLILTAFLYRLVRAEASRHDRTAALFAALFFFGSTFIYHWVPLFRIDLPGVAFTFAGVYCIWRWEKDRGGATRNAGRRPALLGAAVLFFLLALYTKHSLLFAPAAALGALWLRDRRAAVTFALALGLVGGLAFGALEIATRGGWSFGILTANATVWTTRVFLPLFSSFITTYMVLVLLGLWGWWTRVVGARKLGIVELYAVTALASIALAGREGAWENYFIEATAMVCLFAGLALADLRASARGQWVLPVLLFIQLGLYWNEHDPRIAQNLFDQARLGNQHIGLLVRATPGPLVSEDMGLLITNGKPVVYYSFPYSTLARAGRWDQHWEVENLRARTFPLVILMQGTRTDVDRFGNFTRAFASALDANYAVATEDVRYQVYAPAPLQFAYPHVVFGDLLELVGWSLEPPVLRAGTELTLTTVWHARSQPSARLTTFAHLENASGAVAQDDHEPQRGTYPTTHWAQDEMVRDTYHIPVPATLAPGAYSLRVGWYETATLDRLTSAEGADFVELQKFAIP